MSFTRPGTCAIFATDATGIVGVKGKLLAFLITNTVIADVPGRVRFDLTRNVKSTRTQTVANSPLQAKRIGNIITNPEIVSFSGSLSATPLGLGGLFASTFSRVIRRDITQTNVLRKLQELEEPLVLVTPDRAYSSGVLLSMSSGSDGTHKTDIDFVYREVQIVSPLSVVTALEVDAMLAGAGGVSNDGAQALGEVADPGGLA